jgi:hypothetical protein
MIMRMNHHKFGTAFNVWAVGLFLGLCCGGPVPTQAAGAMERPATFCNPLNLPYRFRLEPPSRREAADPTLVRFQGEYWLFASKSGGYWHSSDLAHWKFVQPTGLPLEDYAPTVEVMDGRLYFTAFGTPGIFSTVDPIKGVWTKIADLKGYPDPDLFRDDDGRLYVYFGCGHNGDIQAVELDPHNDFKVVKGPLVCFSSDYARHGWEVAGEDNRGVPGKNEKDKMAPWTEGSWMTKHDGIYYLQYSAPGTQFKSYADGVYTATNPLGPFQYAAYSPFSQKPTGFIGGAGHSSTVKTGAGDYWHIVTMPISVRHMFERRLGLFPAGFEPDGQMLCDTYLGDYPQYAPESQPSRDGQHSPGWMLLSYDKPATASSSLPGYPVPNAFDEDVRTWWSATSGNAGEWLAVDLGKLCRLEAMQINFADQGATNLGRLENDGYRFRVEISPDGTNWETCLDRSDNSEDTPHDYAQLDQPVLARYVRLVNRHMPGGGLFSVSGFRIFGNGLGQPPEPVRGVTVQRDAADQRRIQVSWSPVKNADFYIIRYGIKPDRLFNNYQVYQTNRFGINSLNVNTAYYLTVDAVNDSGISRGSDVLSVK